MHLKREGEPYVYISLWKQLPESIKGNSDDEHRCKTVIKSLSVKYKLQGWQPPFHQTAILIVPVIKMRPVESCRMAKDCYRPCR
jgi:hypothetical protein